MRNIFLIIRDKFESAKKCCDFIEYAVHIGTKVLEIHIMDNTYRMFYNSAKIIKQGVKKMIPTTAFDIY